MVSQTEQSDLNSQDEAESQPQSDQPQSQPEQVDLPDQPQPDLSLDQPEESHQQDTSEPEELSAEPESPIPAAEEPVASEPEQVEVASDHADDVQYADLNDVAAKFESMSPELKSHVSPILTMARSAQTSYEIAAQKYESAKAELVQFAEDLKDYGVDSEPIIEKFQSQQQKIAELNDSIVSTTWSAFMVSNPNYKEQPQKLQNVFSEIVSTMLDRFPGRSTLDKLNAAYKYAHYSVGPETKKVKAVQAKPAAPKPVVQKPPVNVDSKAQSLVNDGRVSGSQSMLDVADMSWDEILDRHKHLLGD